MTDAGGSLDNFRIGTDHQKEQDRIRWQGLSALSPASREGKGLKVEPITNGQWLNQSLLSNEAYLKP